MKILFVTDSIDCWTHGIWFHRQQMPSYALSNRGHAIKQVAMGTHFPPDILNWPDTVIFGRTYATHFEPIKWMREFKKLGKRVLYDMDDDFWNVSKDNPSVMISNALKDQYEGMIREADAIITTSEYLASRRFRKLVGNKKIFICPNGTNPDVYPPRPKEHQELIIGYSGAASHWKDLQLVGEVISELSKKHDFIFTIYGMVSEPMEATFYTYNRLLREKLRPEKNEYFKSALGFRDQLKDVKFWHVPFMPPELHPGTLSRCDFDIGIAPLEDTEFNHGKSCVKFYEYASVGTVTLASDVLPYNKEVNYLAKNTFKDWYKKLEKLIVDKPFREKILKEQMEYVQNERSPEKVGLMWELACQQPGGLKVLNQS